MTPYYDKDGITIYHGDCREVMADMPDKSVELVLTDPPWMAQKKGVIRRSKGVSKVIEPSKSISYGDIGVFDKAALMTAFTKTSNDMMVLCGFKEMRLVCEVLEPVRGIFGWHKPNGGISVAYPAARDLAFIVWGAHTSKITGFQHWRSSVFSISVPTAGCISNGERFVEGANGKAKHPAQGPVALYRQLLKPSNGSVLDPYMGTGTTLRAAKDLGRKAIGIEIEERYCEIAAKRLEQGILPCFA